jgi:hypothetical protein
VYLHDSVQLERRVHLRSLLQTVMSALCTTSAAAGSKATVGDDNALCFCGFITPSPPCRT